MNCTGKIPASRDWSEANFEQEVLGAARPVLVQFWAGRSELCKTMAPVLQSAAQDGAVPIKMARVNVEQNEALAEKYGVRAVPTVLLFDQGGLKDQIIGRATEREVRDKLRHFK